METVADAPVGGSGGRLDREQQGGWNEHDAEGKEDDVPAGRVADGEELSVPAEKIEERLCEGERGERRKVDAPDRAQRACTSFTCARPFGSVIQMT